MIWKLPDVNRPASSTAPRHWTVADLLDWTETRFRELDLPTPRLDAELLLAHAMSCTRLELYTGYRRIVETRERSAFRTLVERRSGFEPVAYILGAREFYSLRLEVTPAVLVPRPETEHLVDRVIEELAETAEPRLLDIGTGSGNIAIALLANLPSSRAVATDISAEALDVARRNAMTHGVADRIELLEGDLLEPLEQRDAIVFDAIISNPPYVSLSEYPGLMRDVREHEPELALVDRRAGSGLGFYRDIIRGAPPLLAPGGLIAFEVGATQAPAVERMLREGGWQATRTVADYAGIPRVVTARRASEPQSR